MAQAWARAFYNGSNWLSCRDSFKAERIAIDGGLCQDCKDQLGTVAHHWPVMLTKQNINRPEISLNRSNLRWVCEDCHSKYPGHGVAKAITPLLTFDANGDPIPPSKKP